MLISLRDAEINTEITGSGKPMLMIHGNWCDHRLMKGCMESIFTVNPEGKKTGPWKRIYFDLPGMGDTILRKEISSTDEIVGIIDEFIKEVIHEEVFYIASESYGSYLARAFVKKYPERVGGIMMLCPVVIPLLEERDLPHLQISYRDSEFYETLQQRDRETCDRMLTVQNRENWQRYLDEVRCGVKKSDISLLKRIKKTRYSLTDDPDNLARPFSSPSLIITGRQDLAVGYRDALSLVDIYTGSDFAILDRAGHMLQIEQKEVFEKLVIHWLRRLEKVA